MTLTPKQREVIRLMREGWSMYRDPMYKFWIVNEQDKKTIRAITKNQLLWKGIISPEGIYYTLTPLGREI